MHQIVEETFGNICAVSVDKTSRNLFTVDDLSFLRIKHRGSDIIVMDGNKRTQSRFGRSGQYSGPTSWYHDIVVDKDQNIYVGDILGNSIQKFKLVAVK